MADDIVTALREARIYNCYSCVEYGYDDKCDCASRRLLHNAAADEIERLRAELTQLRWDNRRLADLHEGLYYATEEARRG